MQYVHIVHVVFDFGIFLYLFSVPNDFHIEKNACTNTRTANTLYVGQAVEGHLKVIFI